MALRPCIQCGELTTGSRCSAHRRPERSKPERNRRAECVAQHRAQYGDWCPGWRRPAHAATDLTADHVTAVAAGGAEAGPLQVLCRVCNSSKRDNT